MRWCCFQYLQFVRLVTSCLSIATAFGIVLIACPISAAQQWDGQSGISSSEFLQLMPSADGMVDNARHLFPKSVTDNAQALAELSAAQEAAEKAKLAAQAASVQKVNFESSAAPEIIASSIGTGANSVTQYMPSESMVPPAISPWPTNVTAAPAQAPRRWLSSLSLDSNMPTYFVGFEVVGFRRSNDTVGPYSDGGRMSRFDQEVTGRYTVSKLLGAIERLEFKLTGPFHWERQLDSIGPIDSRLPTNLSVPFDNADRHVQSQSVRLSSYELNRCITGDEFSKFFYGVRLIDLEERYQLSAIQGGTTRLFGLKAHNLMVGPQFGMEVRRPLSQRLDAGGVVASGLYGNFAKGALSSTTGSSTNVDLRDDRLRLSMVLETAARINYRFTPNIFASGGYEFWYFPALATAANQRLDYAASVPAYSLRTGDDQLFRGWTIGLSARF